MEIETKLHRLRYMDSACLQECCCRAQGVVSKRPMSFFLEGTPSFNPRREFFNLRVECNGLSPGPALKVRDDGKGPS
jgi:hypothetical protein